ncbi:sodium- and chloride-dependent glycine transporter 1-like [Ruditapes philippinarum]|uniref:sodium- and chloride-dependent glycine transporter 1-like n=1 Tax=Ruditapes philippinarum TaxID=129788 RepID=UPI00295AB903|nr:sodium- and chloride-dependent glycine transporter 1-like [Ruditapes philippinarum]
MEQNFSATDEIAKFRIGEDLKADVESIDIDETSELQDIDDVHDDDKDEAERDTWGGEFEFMLSLVGYTVGLGNIWRFPYFCYRNGGGCAIIPFILFLTICGGPLYYLEVCLGQWSGMSPITVWNICPLFKGVGLVMVSLSLIYIWYYGAAFSWVIYFLIQSFYPTLPWSRCGQSWNTELCIDSTTNTTDKMLNMTNNGLSVTSITFRSASTEFFERNVLQKSSGIDVIGSIQPHLIGCFILGWLLVFLCLAKGVKSLGKVVYVTVTLPYILLTALLIRGVTLDGAWNGLQLYLIPDFSRLIHGQVWIEAAVQCFFSLGPAWGGAITMASFNKFNHNALRDSVVVCIADAFTGIYSGVVVFSVIGFLSKETGTSIDELPFSGAGLAFIAYPEALSRLPVPHAWSILFFLTLVLVGIDTQFGCFETVTNAFIDLNYKKLHKYRLLISAGLVIFLIISGIPLTTSAGYYIFMLIDSYMGTFNLVGTALLECIVVAWIYGANRFSDDIETMLGKRPNILLRLIWCFVIPLFLLGIFIPTIVSYTTPTLGSYEYPIHAQTIGNLFAFVPISLIPIVAVYQVIQQSCSGRNIKDLLKPAVYWEPHDSKIGRIYRKTPYVYGSNFRERLLNNILGINTST